MRCSAEEFLSGEEVSSGELATPRDLPIDLVVAAYVSVVCFYLLVQLCFIITYRGTVGFKMKQPHALIPQTVAAACFAGAQLACNQHFFAKGVGAWYASSDGGCCITASLPCHAEGVATAARITSQGITFVHALGRCRFWKIWVYWGAFGLWLSCQVLRVIKVFKARAQRHSRHIPHALSRPWLLYDFRRLATAD